MGINITVQTIDNLKPRITVFGVGGAGGNAINNMINKELEGVEFVVANTDAQALQQSQCETRIQMGIKITEGLGAGSRATVGAAAAEESIEQIVHHLEGAHMCFITAGMGGGTGTGAAPVIAQAARKLGVLTVGIVTKPFQFEGAKRMKQAEDGIDVLQKVVDTLIIIPNQNLFRIANETTTFTEAFQLADDVLYYGVKGVTDLMVRPGIINLDFADVRAVMDEMGKAMMGTGEAEGDNRAIQAAEKAIANPLLDEVSLEGAKGVLINITGGHDLTLFELDEAANTIRDKVDRDANIIVGSTLDTGMDGKIRVSVVATGIDAIEAGIVLIDDTVADYHAILGETNDDLSPPAHQPHAEREIENPEAFIAPRASVSGTPSPEAMTRLLAAVGHAQEAEMQVELKHRADDKKPRFGINSLIGRMTGTTSQATESKEAYEENRQAVLNLDLETEDDEAVRELLLEAGRKVISDKIKRESLDASVSICMKEVSTLLINGIVKNTHTKKLGDVIEIPAFLRRQAN